MPKPPPPPPVPGAAFTVQVSPMVLRTLLSWAAGNAKEKKAAAAKFLILTTTFFITFCNNHALSQVARPNFELSDSLINSKYFTINMYCISFNESYVNPYYILSPDLFIYLALTNDTVLSACKIGITDALTRRVIVTRLEPGNNIVLEYSKDSFRSRPIFDTRSIIVVKHFGYPVEVISISKEGLFMHNSYIVSPSDIIYNFVKNICSSCHQGSD